MMLGALILGPIADRVGRKPVLVAGVLLFGTVSLLTATATSAAQLIAFRFFWQEASNARPEIAGRD